MAGLSGARPCRAPDGAAKVTAEPKSLGGFVDLSSAVTRAAIYGGRRSGLGSRAPRAGALARRHGTAGRCRRVARALHCARPRSRRPPTAALPSPPRSCCWRSASAAGLLEFQAAGLVGATTLMAAVLPGGSRHRGAGRRAPGRTWRHAGAGALPRPRGGRQPHAPAGDARQQRLLPSTPRQVRLCHMPGPGPLNSFLSTPFYFVSTLLLLCERFVRAPSEAPPGGAGVARRRDQPSPTPAHGAAAVRGADGSPRRRGRTWCAPAILAAPGPLNSFL